MPAVRAIIVVCALSTQIFGQSNSYDWPGWRGLERQGVHESARPPISWSNRHNVAWHVDVPGRGHSSPVISDGRVFLTAAYAVQRGESVQQALIALTFGWIASTALLGFRLLRTNQAILLPDRTTFGARSSVVVFLVGLLGFVTLGAFGPWLLDFDRCVIRSWLGTNLTVTLGILLAATATTKPVPRALTILGLIAIGIVTVVAMPSKEHAFRGGYLSASALLVMTTGAVPIVVALMCLRRYTNRAISVALLLCGWFVAYWIGVAPGLSTEAAADEDSSEKLIAFLSLALVVPIVGWLILALSRFGWGPQSVNEIGCRRALPWSYVLYNLLAAVVIVGISFGLIWLAIAHSGYLRYHLTFPNHPLSYPKWPYVCLGLIVLPVGYLANMPVARVSTRFLCRSPASPFWLSAIITSTLLFIDHNLFAPTAVLTRAILCYDLDSGKQLWTIEGLEGAEGLLHRYNSPATPTPVVYDNKLYAYFGSTGLMCTTIDGQRVWANREVRFQSAYGVGVSPIVHSNLVIVVNGVPDAPHIVACDISTGEIVWRTDLKRDVRVSGHSRTPLVCRTDSDQDVLIIWGGNTVDGIDVHTGKMLWSVPLSSSGDMVASVIRDKHSLFFVDDSRTTAIELAGLLQGRPQALWSRSTSGSNCSSPVIGQDLLFMVTDNGIAKCLDAGTGTIHWRKRIGGGHYASPVIANGNVYFISIEGVTTVVAADSELHVLESNDLAEAIFASPALTRDSLLIRTINRLYKLTEK